MKQKESDNSYMTMSKAAFIDSRAGNELEWLFLIGNDISIKHGYKENLGECIVIVNGNQYRGFTVSSALNEAYRREFSRIKNLVFSNELVHDLYDERIKNSN